MTEIQTKDPLILAMEEKFAEVDTRAEIAKAGESGMEWLPNWYTRYKGEIQDSIMRLDAAYQAAKKQIEAEGRALDYRWGMALREEIDKQFADGAAKKKKSIRNLFGKIGYRKVASRISVIIDDDDIAIKEAETICPEVIKKSLSKTAIKKIFEETGLELEGTHIEESDEYQKFYIQPEQKLLT